MPNEDFAPTTPIIPQVTDVTPETVALVDNTNDFDTDPILVNSDSEYGSVPPEPAPTDEVPAV